ncbi:guanine nucleotide-binding protein subunit gamma-1-like [Penaeus monodon]|uniref:guanine nucleotide-binding protein subunit gamma-1-like n=1 Tax=Penaeus monodon TaxID=6687 RepID=UPI0018A7177A|nr:guanine nucleotide-binding protein subunit gamma-1-like [Penaeus monodon]
MDRRNAHPRLLMSSQQQLRVLVDQLQREANIERMNTSEAINQLKEYVREHQKDDYLCHPMRNPRANPFREKSICHIL